MLRSSLPRASDNSRLSVLPSRTSFAIFLWVGESVYLPQRMSNCRSEITICLASAGELPESAAFFAPPGLKLPRRRRYPSRPRSEWPRIRRFTRPGKKESGNLALGEWVRAIALKLCEPPNAPIYYSDEPSFSQAGQVFEFQQESDRQANVFEKDAIDWCAFCAAPRLLAGFHPGSTGRPSLVRADMSPSHIIAHSKKRQTPGSTTTPTQKPLSATLISGFVLYRGQSLVLVEICAIARNGLFLPLGRALRGRCRANCLAKDVCPL